MTIETLERRIREAETGLIMLTIAAIATGDYFVGLTASLGPLYLIPLSYSALTHRLRTTVALTVLCVALRQLLGPIDNSGLPMMMFVRDIGIIGLFMVPVVYLYRLGKRRRAFFELARRQRDDLEREVAMAAALQERMLALGEPPAQLDVVARTIPLKGVGGDYYDFIVGADQKAFVVVADVAGKGLPAAMLMPAVQIGLRAAAAHNSELSTTIEELNRTLFMTTAPESYATLFIAGIDTRDGELEYVNAGHLPGLLVAPDGKTRWLERGGIPVGLLMGSAYEAGRAVLEPEGLLVLYSDGVTEAEDASGRAFGRARLKEVVVASRDSDSQAIVAAIHAEVERFVAGGLRTDDTTVIAVRRLRPADQPS